AILLAGAAVGGAASCLLMGGDRVLGTSADNPVWNFGSGSAAPNAQRALKSSASARVDGYGDIVALSDPETLEARLANTAALRPSTARDFELRALLARLLELDANRAARATRRLGLGSRILAEAFAAWAAHDSAAALDAVATIEH